MVEEHAKLATIKTYRRIACNKNMDLRTVCSLECDCIRSTELWGTGNNTVRVRSRHNRNLHTCQLESVYLKALWTGSSEVGKGLEREAIWNTGPNNGGLGRCFPSKSREGDIGGHYCWNFCDENINLHIDPQNSIRLDEHHDAKVRLGGVRQIALGIS